MKTKHLWNFQTFVAAKYPQWSNEAKDRLTRLYLSRNLARAILLEFHRWMRKAGLC
jgi:hypothetical protein